MESQTPSLLDLLRRGQTELARVRLEHIAIAAIAVATAGCAEATVGGPSTAGGAADDGGSPITFPVKLDPGEMRDDGWMELDCDEPRGFLADASPSSGWPAETIAFACGQIRWPAAARSVECDGAEDMSACLATLRAAHEDEWEGPCWALGIRDGDEETLTYLDDAALREFLGPIDAPGDALVSVWAQRHDLGCGNVERGAVRRLDDGSYQVVATRMVQDCAPIVVERYLFHVSVDGDVTQIESEEIERDEGACVGRIPRGMGGACVDATAEHARLEAASVLSFERLARDLARHDAPAELIAWAERAADEERDHAARVADSAASAPAPVVVDGRVPRSLEALAIDNAREGCGRELFGAVVGWADARIGEGAVPADAMRRIADDELGHAMLSFAIDTWLRTKVSAETARRMDEARDAMLARLAMSSERPVARVIARQLRGSIAA